MASPLSKCKKIGLIVVILIPLTVVIVFPFIFKYAAHVSDPGDSYPITKTLHIISNIQNTMDLMLTIEGYKNPVELKTIKEYARKTNDRVMERYIHNNQICDAWKNPILLFLEEPLKYKFISCGPNKRFDNGKEDDIVVIIDWDTDGIQI